MNDPRLSYLFEKYYSKTANPEETEELARLMSMKEYREQFTRLMAEAWDKYEGADGIISSQRTEDILHAILHTAPPTSFEIPTAKDEKRLRIGSFPAWVRMAAAAAVVFLLISGYQIWHRRSSQQENPTMAQSAKPDINPGGFKARLVLADGRSIVLDSAGMGELAQQGSTAVVNNNGQVIYRTGKNDTGNVMYNTISTGKGETYAFTLSDGSRVWLNSASSINFPVSFPGRQRLIRTTGEVYVKVAKDPSKTFAVTTKGMEVQALGTEFDINAYPDEEHVNATLVEGAVKLSGGSKEVILKPGQQAHLESSGTLSLPEEVEVEEVVSWKEGNFQFESADIHTILRQLARWYDVEVVYEGGVKEKKFFGIISRNSTLSNVLQVLKSNDIRFRIEGKKLYVTPI
jgi:ferric-dicitrate binding protein FerR (iron transport regulator)